MSMKCWYAVHTKPHSETVAQSNLESLGIEVFLPLFREHKGGRGRSHPVRSPLFPGYLFARVDMLAQYRTVTYARGVRRIVAFGSVPAVVDDGIVSSIQRQTIDGVIELSEGRLTPGQIVRIHDGLLHGLEAVFEKKMSGTRRAVLLLKTLSYQARVIVETQHVANL